MGTSTDAILVFGIPLPEDSIAEYPAEEDSPEEGIEYLAWSGDREGDVELLTHCSSDYPQYIVALYSTVTRAHRGYVKEIRPEGLARPSEERLAELRAFVAKYKLKTEGEPGWYLCSYWG